MEASRSVALLERTGCGGVVTRTAEDGSHDQLSGGVVESDSVPRLGKDLRPALMMTTATMGDINAAAALRAQSAIDTPRVSRRRKKKTAVVDEDVEPLVDHTATLELHSKKTERLQKRQLKKSQKAASQPAALSLLDLPSELLLEIFRNLRPSDLHRLQRTCHVLQDFISVNEAVLSTSMIKYRYWNLYRCFPLPIPFKDVPLSAHRALLSPKRQEMLNIHRKSYHQHVQMIDPHEICTCMTCVFAWNNLCLVVDLHHWQPKFERREPIPMVARGTNPEWNVDLLDRNAGVVRRAIKSQLAYACILEKHLCTITDTIARSAARMRRKVSRSSPSSRLYHMTERDVEDGTDRFLGRSGPPSYDFPFHRDNYYGLEAYLPNRKWSVEAKKWYYYGLPPIQHERDLEWVMAVDRQAKRPGKTMGVGKEERRDEEKKGDSEAVVEDGTRMAQ